MDFIGARDSEWQWHQLGHMQICTSLQTNNHASTPPLSFLQAGCPSCRPTNSIKALKDSHGYYTTMALMRSAITVYPAVKSGVSYIVVGSSVSVVNHTIAIDPSI